MNLITFQMNTMITLHGEKEKEGGMEGRGKEGRKEFIQGTNKHNIWWAMVYRASSAHRP